MRASDLNPYSCDLAGDVTPERAVFFALNRLRTGSIPVHNEL